MKRLNGIGLIALTVFTGPSIAATPGLPFTEDFTSTNLMDSRCARRRLH